MMKKFQLIRFISIAVLCHMGFIGTRFSASLYALDKHVSTFTIGVILALFSLIPMLISVRAGRWIDTSGPLRPTLSGIALISVGALLPLLFSYEVADLAPLLVGASMVGTGLTLTILSMQQHLGEQNAPSKRTAVFSWFAMGVSVSGFFGPVLGGIVIDHFGHRISFLLPIFFSLVAGAFLLFGEKPATKNKAMTDQGQMQNTFDLIRYRELRHVLIVTGLISMCWDLQNFAVPLHGTRAGLSASQIGFILGAFAIATFAIRILMPVLHKFSSEWQILIGTLGCASLAFLIFPLLQSYVSLICIAFLLGLGLGAAQPNIMTLVHSTSPSGRVAEALGLRLTIIHSNQVILPLIFGAFGALLGTTAMFWGMSLIALFGVFISVRAGKHRRTST
jgi:MFS family permease